MKRFLIALAICISVSIPVSAGQIPTVPEPDASPQTTGATAAPGDMPAVPGDIPSLGAQAFTSQGITALLEMLGFFAV